jgi:D-alanyl-D-alanine carboxypeptidase/D-alanyl-D-alanine-endopeptidase (penicillin-binding protein 4)
VDGSIAEGVRVVRAFLTTKAGIDANDFVFFDGSGLSSHDLVTPRATAKLLRFATTQPWGGAWKASLPIGGEDGSLRRRFADANGAAKGIRAKTGSLSRALALSGYAESKTYGRLAFSILVNDFAAPQNEVRAWIDKIALTLLE